MLAAAGLLSAGCGLRKAGVSAAESGGGSTSTGTTSTTTTGTSTGTTTTGTGTGTTTTGTGTGTTTTGTSTSTSTGPATGTSTTGGSTGVCELFGGTGTGTGGGGAGSWEGHPYYGKCETDADCVTELNEKWCLPGRCWKTPQGNVCDPPWSECKVGWGQFGRVSVPFCPSMEPLSCSEEAKNHPEYSDCGSPDTAIWDVDCEMPMYWSYCDIPCNPPSKPCPEGMVCSLDPPRQCVWPP